MTEPESPSVAAMRDELGKHADVERIVCRIPGHTVPTHMLTANGRARFRFAPLRGEVPSVAARLISAMRGGGK